jgi:hypothetical protein
LRKIVTLSLIVLINIVFINVSLGQNLLKNKTYNQNNFEKNKVFNDVYNLWGSYKGNWFSKSKDSISYFVDDRNYKGIVNYGVTFRSKNYINFNFIENLSMCFLKVEINNCNYNPKDSVINIEGFVSGREDWGWNEFVKGKKTKNYINIFLGERKDTIKACYLGKIVDKDTIEVKLNNKEIDEFTVLDKFPAFYLKNYSYYRTALEGRYSFKISGKVTKNTLLAFGSCSSYSEIFDLGSMIYYLNKNNQEKNIKKQEPDCKTLIIKNKLVADIEKEKTQKEEINYYTYTQNAENYILIRQFARAKEQYNLLNQNYPSLFARDIHNAIRCAILSRDFKTAFWWGEKLAYKGVELPYFNSKIFVGMRKNPEWKIFSIKFDSICKLTKNNLNLKLKNELTDLLNEDQADYGLEKRKDPKVLYETTERITGKLIDLLKSEGYPSEDKTGIYVEKDTILISFPDYNVLFRHAIQQKPKNLAILSELLDKYSNTLEYDRKRSFVDVMPYNSCFHIYKGNLYNSKACGRNDLMVRKITFKFRNPYGFIMDYGNFIVSEYNPNSPKEWDDYYEQNYNFIMKLTEDWKFYEK